MLFGRYSFSKSQRMESEEMVNGQTRVLLTGGTGYIAGWIVRKLLERGVTVHTTVRDLSKRDKYAHLVEMEQNLPGTLRLFEADLLKKGSFEAAMEGCEYVIHSASPFQIRNIKDPQKELVDPALHGTENVLKQVNEAGAVKRVVLTSSVVAVYGDNKDLQESRYDELTERDWNTTSNLHHQPYNYSKTLAEKKAWEMAEKQDRWSLVTINPGFVLGPALTKRKDSTSIETILQMGDGTMKMGVPDLPMGIVDVRDVAEAHVRAAFNSQASGRHIVVDKVLSFGDIAAILKKEFGDEYPFPQRVLPKWLVWLVGPTQGLSRKYISRNVGIPIKISNERARQDLGIEFRPVEESIREQFRNLVEDGVVKKGA